MISFSVTVPEEVSGRIDAVLSSLLEDVPRSQLRSRLGALQCDGKTAKLSARVGPGAIISGTLEEPTVPHFEPENIPLTVVAEADTWVVVDKPQGMVVHPGNGNHTGTLIHALAWRYRDESFFSPAPHQNHISEEGEEWSEEDTEETTSDTGPFRPGIVHRLDKDTSGVIIVARTEHAHRWLSTQFAERAVEKRYLAIIAGVPPYTYGWISAPIGRDPHHRTRFSTSARVADMGRGEPPEEIQESVDAFAAPLHQPTQSKPRARRMRPALTSWRTIRTMGRYSLVELHPYTGRTHQLRVHMKHMGMPIVGDPLYARHDARLPDTTLLLHAYQLSLIPGQESDAMTFKAPAPHRFGLAIRALVKTHTSSSR